MDAASDQAPQHVPVLVDPLLRIAVPAPGETVLDGTVGLGGHAVEIIPRILPGGRYVGLDLDPAMLEVARGRLQFPPGVLALEHANYADFPAVLTKLGIAQVDLLLLDLGVNSAQLADPARGFSFQQEGPLDMRYDPKSTRKALDLVNGLSEAELADIFYEYGQEGMSRRVARRICQVRHGGRITTTQQLARAVESAYAAAGGGQGKIHDATRVFQALRIAVNLELDNLKRFLAECMAWLAPGGRLAVIAFHSLEDALVKQFIRQEKAAGRLAELTPRPAVAEAAERSRNPRSRSAKLRVAKRV